MSEKAVHAGHRARMRERFMKEGLSGFSEHEVLEFLLMFAIPQRDVNPLAHRLIDRFGSLSAVLESSPAELTRVDGVGENAAALLSLMPQLMGYYQHSAMGRKPVITNLAEARKYAGALFFGLHEERVYMICVDQSGRVLHPALMHRGTIDQVQIYPREVVETALRYHAHAVLLAHNHPSGMTEPSQDDYDSTRAVIGALNVIGVRAGEKFLSDLKGVTDPERKRKIIGRDFIEVFDAEAQKLTDVRWLAQGTIYPDVIESTSVNGPSATIKSHHNVGGLPEKMNLKIVEPLRLLFKDEVRRVGRQLEIPSDILNRHPFPGPGLGIRILGEVTAEKVRILQEADKIFIDGLKEYGLYDQVWQAGVMLLPVQSVGVMGDERTYESCVALRAVTSTDGMTADWVHLPYDFLAKMSNDIINRVKGINRVVYDISSKPPATIEWE